MSSIRSDGPTRFEKEFMARLIARRKKLGVTQVELARRAGMTQPNLARYESLSVSPTLSALSRLCEALSVDMALDPIGYIGKRVLVIGCPGSGKSYFSKKLSATSGIPRIHIDNQYWNEDKTHISREELLAKFDEVFALDSFLLDGNYLSTLDNRIFSCPWQIMEYGSNPALCSICEKSVDTIGALFDFWKICTTVLKTI